MTNQEFIKQEIADHGPLALSTDLLLDLDGTDWIATWEDRWGGITKETLHPNTIRSVTSRAHERWSRRQG